MPDGFTDNFGFTTPEVGGSPDTWGQKLNGNWAQLDSLLKQRLDALDNAVAAAEAAAAARTDSLVGVVVWWPGSVAQLPPNMLVANGQKVTRASRPKLFAKVGTTHNTGGESSAEFRLPALQDRYIRATASASDSGIGELLDDSIKAHGHSATTSKENRHRHTGETQDAGQHKPTGKAKPAGGHKHQVKVYFSGGEVGDPTIFSSTGRSTVVSLINETGAVPDHEHQLDINTVPPHKHDFESSYVEAHDHQVTVNQTGGSETRPKSIRLTPVIFADWPDS